jgi:hypothetical protein
MKNYEEYYEIQAYIRLIKNNNIDKNHSRESNDHFNTSIDYHPKVLNSLIIYISRVL